MDEKIKNLISILEKEVDLYREFLHLLQIEKQCMTDLSLDRLQACSRQKELTLDYLQTMEEDRRDILASMQDDHPSKRVTLSTIIEEIPLRYNKAMKACCANLISLVNSIRKTNQINSILAARMINYTRPSLSFLNRLVSDLQVNCSIEDMKESNIDRLIYRRRW